MMNRPAVQKFTFQVLWLCFVTLVPCCMLFWFHYHHLPHWSTFVLNPAMAVLGSAALNYREARKR